LTELDLVGPNALIVVPRRGGGAQNDGGSDDSFSLLALFWLFIAPFIFIFELLRDMVFGAPKTQQLTEAQPQSDAASTIAAAQETENRKRPEGVRQRPSPGNIHRLRQDLSDSDSDDPTWNGNSTQQL